jgi:hypothetical protein
MANIGLSEEQIEKVLERWGMPANDAIPVADIRRAIAKAITVNNEAVAETIVDTIRECFKEHDNVQHK